LSALPKECIVSADKMKKTTTLAIVFGVMLLCSGAYAATISGSNQLIVLSSAAYNGGSDDVAKSIDTDRAGNILITGYSSSLTRTDYLTMKYAKSLPEATYQVAVSTGISGSEPHGVAVDNNDDVILAGQIFDGSKYTISVRKYKDNITIAVATATYSINAQNHANALVTDAQSNIYVTGYVNDGLKNKIITLKYNKELTLIGQPVIYQSGDSNIGNAIVLDSQDNIFVAGESQVGGLWNFCVIKYNSALVQQQVYLLGNGTVDGCHANSIAIDSAGNIIVTGKRYNSSTISWEYFTVKLDNAMNLLASASYDTATSGGHDIATGVAVDSLDNIIVTGSSYNGTNTDYLTIKYDNNLNVLSSDIYDSGLVDVANAVTVDIDDNILVTGSRNNDYFTIKYNGTPSISAISQAYQGETGEIVISGKCFLDAQVSYTEPGIILTSTIPSPSNSSIQIFSDITVGANVLLGLTTVTVTNANGEKSSRNNLLNIAHRTIIAFDVDTVITKLTLSGEIKIEIPAYTYAQNETLVLSASASTAPTSGGTKSVGVGMNAAITPDGDGVNDITITLKYNPEFATGLDESRFVIAYYDDATLSWVEMPSTPYPAEDKVTTKTKTLGKKFIIVQAVHYVPIVTGTRNVYPNPYKPNSSGEYGMSSYGDGVVFAHLVKNFKIKIFNVAGELIYTKDAVSDTSDNYLWDTKCDNGEKAASGIYIFVIEDTDNSANKTKGKFSIIR